MLTMNVELWPFGDEEKAKRLVTINLANMGQSYTGDMTGHDYVWTIDEPAPLYGKPISAAGTLKNYDRKASCVNMMWKILNDFQFTVEAQELTKYEQGLVEKLRNKTK